MSQLESLGRHPRLGALFSLCAAVSIGITPSFSKYAYQEGADVLFVLLLDGLVPMVALWVYAIIIKQPLNIKEIPIRAVILSSIALIFTAYGALYAITFISPNLMIVILYTFPMMVFFTIAFLTKKRPSLKLTLIYLTVFIGLILTVGPQFNMLHPLGLILAVVGAIGSACMYFVDYAANHKIQTHRLVFVGSVSVTILTLILIIITGDYQTPYSVSGWVFLIAAELFYALGIFLIFLSVAFLRPDLGSLIMNIEPFVAIGTAYLLLGDVLLPLQWAGVCVVIGAVSLGGILAHKENIELD
ncbi:MAG: DMT family transporter [Alphaproteobacteria bacterium]|nr:DMT family transporter [Alphaproteobacteria bacterium]